MEGKKMKQFKAPGSETASVPLKNPEGVRGKEARDVEGQPGARGGGEGENGEDEK